jgi:hypothetical protein
MSHFHARLLSVYAFPVKELYVRKDVLERPLARARAERLMRALGSPPFTVVSDQTLAELEKQWQPAFAQGWAWRTASFDYSEGWTVLLDVYAGTERPQGVRMSGLRTQKGQAAEGRVCQTALEIHCAFGCKHRCAYCHCWPHFRIACDLETLADSLPRMFEEHPAQKLWKFDNLTDTIVLEPEYGASALLVPLFAQWKDRFLLLYTKSDNVEHLLDLKHGGHTLISWSLSPLTQSRLIEVGAPDVHARIEAMRRCSEAGYTVRARLSPIVPLKGWRDEMRIMLDELFSRVTPDVVTIDVLGWCQPDAVPRFMDIRLLEDECRLALERLIRDRVRTRGKHVFPHEVREDILRFTIDELKARSPRTPVSICNETFEMWDALEKRMGMVRTGYVCCCGPDSVPGNPLLCAGV